MVCRLEKHSLKQLTQHLSKTCKIISWFKRSRKIINLNDIKCVDSVRTISPQTKQSKSMKWSHILIWGFIKTHRQLVSNYLMRSLNILKQYFTLWPHITIHKWVFLALSPLPRENIMDIEIYERRKGLNFPLFTLLVIIVIHPEV